MTPRFRSERQPYRLDVCKAAVSGRTPTGCVRLSGLIDGRDVITGDANHIEDLRDGGEAVAVYRRGNNDSSFVPTGRIMVKVSADVTLESSYEAFKELGYSIIRACDSAPNAGWLRHRSDVLVEALLGCERLRRLDVVEFVEPEMLRAMC